MIFITFLWQKHNVGMFKSGYILIMCVECNVDYLFPCGSSLLLIQCSGGSRKISRGVPMKCMVKFCGSMPTFKAENHSF